jgi:hypothetical protein
MDTEQVIVLTFIAGVLGPSVLGLWVTRALSSARRQDLDRHDAVAARVQAVRDAVAVADARRARTAEETTAATHARLEQIHTLVNSNLTDAHERELAATRGMLAMMREVVDLKRDRGLEADPESLTLIEETQVRIDRLSRQLVRRAEQTQIAADQRADADAR